MNDCQRAHFRRKKQSYDDKIQECLKAKTEQDKRISCFLGLIKQIDLMLDENKK